MVALLLICGVNLVQVGALMDNEIDGIGPGKARLYKTGTLIEGNEIVKVRAAGFYAWNECNKREEHVFNVYDPTIFGGDVLRGQFYQSAFSSFVL